MAVSTALRIELDGLASTLAPGFAVIAVVHTPEGILIVRNKDEMDVVPMLAGALGQALERDDLLTHRAREMTSPEWRDKLFETGGSGEEPGTPHSGPY